MEKFKVSFVISGKDSHENKRIDKRDTKEIIAQLKNDLYTRGIHVKETIIKKVKKK